jgi:hypothetical protein
LISLQATGQIVFEQGYFIDLNGKHVDCLIKNEDWLRTPSNITYKLNASADAKVLDGSEMKEFAVLHNKYVRALVKVDTSSQRTKNLSITRKPLWDTRDVMLKVLVEGKASLYYYDNKDLVLFFYSVDKSPIKQLEYKTYLSRERTTDELKAGENLTYITQLQTEVACGEEAKNLSPFKMKYKLDHLLDYFTRFNECLGGEVMVYKPDKRTHKSFHLKIAPGASMAASKIERVFNDSEEFPSRKLTMRIGIEAEFILPFNNNKWALFVEPTYQTYKGGGEFDITYSSVELPFGLRHYFHLNNNLKLFINVAAVADLPLEYSAKWGNLTVESERFKINFAGGIGLNYKKFSLEGRYYSLRTGLDTTGSFHFDFVKSSVILGYRLF